VSFSVGSLVHARGREWVVLPGDDDKVLVVRPLGGTEDEVTGIYLPLEEVAPAEFPLPDVTRPGDHHSCRLLRDAVRLGFRSGAGPFRSFGRISVEPRPYQLVPLMLALRMDTIRMMIADDVGIGKSIEALLIAREMLDRGEIKRIAVVCPPHLADQWKREMARFHLDATLVLPSTVKKLERDCLLGESLFEKHPFVVVSMDYIKSDHRDEFLRACPDFVIVDEAHACAFSEQTRGGRHQRWKLLWDLSAKPDRHLLMVTATPHNGKEADFRSLLTILDRGFERLPPDLRGKDNEPHRKKLATHFVQRRRADVRGFMDEKTPFPDREEREVTYTLNPGYAALFDKALRFASDYVGEEENQDQRQKRVRWWSALALLRSIASSPAAAAATLRNRTPAADAETADDADIVGSRMVLDQDPEDVEGVIDTSPGADAEGTTGDTRIRPKLLEMAGIADKLVGKKDPKLSAAFPLIKGLVEDGYNPIVFCRFIPTAEYVAEHLKKWLPAGVVVECVTGQLPHAEREDRIKGMEEAERRVLVATDCLSEGINLQEWFDAVFHYDLSWNPTRHEQREGRVDRFGQPKPKVRVLTFYGVDNKIDGLVLEVLLRKHKQIRTSLGYSVPVPSDARTVSEALYHGLLLRGKQRGYQYTFEFAEPLKASLHKEWDNATAKQKESRALYAQKTVGVEDVAMELKTAREAVGSGVDVESFFRDALKGFGASVVGSDVLTVNLGEAPRALKEALGVHEPKAEKFKISFRGPKGSKVISATRAHPLVEGLSSYVLECALDPKLSGPAKRCGVVVTNAVSTRTTLLLVRFRYHLVRKHEGVETPMLAEDCAVVGFEGAPKSPQWMDPGGADGLLVTATPAANMGPEQERAFLTRVVEGYDALLPNLVDITRVRSNGLLQAHKRVRTSSGKVSYGVEPHTPPDIVGVFVYHAAD